MKHLLLTTIAAVVLVGCGPSASERALLEAARDGNLEAVKKHLDTGVDIHVLDKKYGFAPLHYAAQGGYKEIVELLLAKGADVNAKDKIGSTPLLHASDAPLLAADGGRKRIVIVELLIAKGADVNAKQVGGRTPLLSAANYGRKEIAELLIAKGADVNAKDMSVWTPLHYAAVIGQKEIAELLIANGADVNAKSYDGTTPLDGAFFYTNDDRRVQGKKETADLLRKHGGKTGEELKAEGK